MSDVSEVGPSPRKKKSSALPWVLWVGLVGGGIGLMSLFLSLVLPALSQARISGSRRLCLRNVRVIASASILYAADHDGKLPGGKGWVEALQPFTRRRMENTAACPLIHRAHPEQYGIAFNEAIAGKVLASIENEKTPVAFDSAVLKRGAVAGLDTLPNPPRHPGDETANCMSTLNGRAHLVQTMDSPIFTPK